MIGSRIKQARTAAGLALRDLAAQCGVSAMAISKYERDEMAPSSDVLLALAKALGVRVEYFFRQHEVELKEVSYRKHPELPEKEKKRILADARDQLERWLALEEFIPTRWSAEFQMPAGLPSKVSSLDAVENVAAAVRAAWKLGHGAIPDLIDTLEFHGIKVFTTAHDGDQKFDGLSANANGKPVIIIVGGKHAPGDRQRFTLAHELGHLILKGRLARFVDEEKACHRFAGAFLMPTDSVIKLVGRNRSWIEPRELQLVKEEWGLSMAGLMLRARDLGVVTRDTAGQLWKLFLDKGWDKREPDPQYERETSRGFEQLVYRALAEDKVSESKAAELLGLSLVEFVAQRNMEAPPDAARQ
jgi:Zn-dependent peptidase ImmA (M78 family)/transcriptional regulator with XRE-family HTH domain